MQLTKLIKLFSILKKSVVTLFFIVLLFGCLSQNQKSGIENHFGDNFISPEKIIVRSKVLSEEIFSRQDISEERNITVEDLLAQFTLKQEEYCSNKINDLDDFPVDPASMCCNLNFMNLDPQKGKVHYGFDIPLNIGTKLRCPDKEDCLVIRVYPEWITQNGFPQQTIYGLSLLVYFKKANYFGFYAHLRKVKGFQGRIFKYKEIMAYSGNSGSLTTGAHLHFTTFRNQDCLNGTINEKMRLAVLDTIEEIKIFEAKEKGIELSEYDFKNQNASNVLKRCRVKLNQEANRACIARNFPRDFIDPLEVTSDKTIQKLILEINPNRMRETDIIKLFSYHQNVRNGQGVHKKVIDNFDYMPTNVDELKNVLRDINSNILGEEL